MSKGVFKIKSLVYRLLDRGRITLISIFVSCSLNGLCEFIFRRFLRESRVVYAGIRRFNSSHVNEHAHSASLRRAIHRLEKGLIMRPRAATFGSDYILAAVKEYCLVTRSAFHDVGEIRWATDVLREYFETVSDFGDIVVAREMFYHSSHVQNDEGKRTDRWAPRSRGGGACAAIDFDSFFRLCQQRRSVRWFLKAPVPRHTIEQAFTAALYAPSACNRQPFHIRMFDRAEEVVRIAEIAMGTSGYAHQIPTLLVFVGDWSCFEDERDRHLPYIDASLAAMQLMLALETMGLASCPINWPDLERLERKMERMLGLAAYERPIMLLAVGYPDPTGGVAYSAKKPVNTVLVG